MIIKMSFAEAISDAQLLDGLPPVQACLLGGYIGRTLKVHSNSGEAFKSARKMSFMLKNTDGRYRIISEYRDGSIGYTDQKNRKVYKEYPLAIANNKYIISLFDPSDACYIGLLAGIRMQKVMCLHGAEKHIALQNIADKRPELRLIN